jgi:tetratricopeptide (TPR) repeat protein
MKERTIFAGPSKLWLCLFMVVVCQARAQTGNLDNQKDVYTAASICFENLDFQCAIDLYNVARDETNDENRLKEIHCKLAESYLALGQWNMAVSAFIHLLEKYPDFTIETSGVSPKILEAFSEAKRQRRPIQEVVLPSKEKEIDEVSIVKLVSISPAIEFLFGQDRKYMDTGVLSDLEFNFVIQHSWQFGAGLRWSFHDFSKGDQAIHLFGGWLQAGRSWTWEFLQLVILGGVGVTHFGVVDIESKTGVLFPLRLAINIAVSSSVRLGLLTTSSWVITKDQEWQTSYSLGVGARIELVF